MMQAPASAVAIRARGIRARLGGTEVLHGIDLDLPRGRWTSVVGPNGAGKSTLLKALAQLIPHQGSVQLLDRPMTDLAPRARARQLAWLGQNESSGDDLSVWDVAMLGRLPHQAWLAAPDAADHQAVEQALRATQAWDWRDRALGQLSGGERQRVLLARALAEISLALHADTLLIVDQGRVLHHGNCSDADTHRQLERVFDQRITIVPVAGQWVALARVSAGTATLAGVPQ